MHMDSALTECINAPRICHIPISNKESLGEPPSLSLRRSPLRLFPVHDHNLLLAVAFLRLLLAFISSITYSPRFSGSPKSALLLESIVCFIVLISSSNLKNVDCALYNFSARYCSTPVASRSSFGRSHSVWLKIPNKAPTRVGSGRPANWLSYALYSSIAYPPAPILLFSVFWFPLPFLLILGLHKFPYAPVMLLLNSQPLGRQTKYLLLRDLDLILDVIAGILAAFELA